MARIEESSEVYNEESTPTLDDVYKNYRTLVNLQTNACVNLFGYLLTLTLFFILLGAQIYLLAGIRPENFYDWVSCTIFTFMVMVFGTDMLLYLLVAWAMKRSGGVHDKRRCCSLFHLFVLWPLGRVKYQELEIELSKMKDFDKEYLIASLA